MRLDGVDLMVRLKGELTGEPQMVELGGSSVGVGDAEGREAEPQTQPVLFIKLKLVLISKCFFFNILKLISKTSYSYIP